MSIPSSLRNVAVLHSTALVFLIAGGLATARLPVFGFVSVLFLIPLGPLLFLNRPLMWQMAKNGAYLFAFVAGVWLMYSALDVHSLVDVLRCVFFAVLAIYLIGVGGYLKSAPIRAHFGAAGGRQPADS
jgi:hypothetical protein